MENIPENIKFLILKWQSGTLSDEERYRLFLWYDSQSPEDLIWEGDSEESLEKRMYGNILSQIGDRNVVKPKSSFTSIRIWGSAVAASLIIGFLISRSLLLSSDSAPLSTVTTGGSNLQKIILSDQTIVWLKENSKLVYPTAFNGQTRDIELEGEALFEVAKDKSKPFIIHSGPYSTKVLGTSFSLKVNPKKDQLDLVVLTGRVEVSKKKMGFVTVSKNLVQANEQFHTNADKSLKSGLEMKQQRMSEITDGTQYEMNFISVPVEEIMSRFEKKFDVRFEGYTGEYSSCKVTANMTDQSLETSLKLLSLSINCNYNINGKMIKLTGGGCF